DGMTAPHRRFEVDMTTTVVAAAFGGPENLSAIEESTREPGPGEVPVAVRAAGVNPVGYKSYSGVRGSDPASLPIRLGLEAGGVGLMAVQLAALRGATVIATASERNHDLLRALGAVPVTYGDGLADRVRAAAPQGVTAALDLVGSDEALDVSLELVADRGRIATIANFVRGPA